MTPVYRQIAHVVSGIFSNYWMRLSRIWRSLQVEEKCYPPRPRLKAEVDNTLRDLQNSSYPTKAEFNNCFIIYSKYSLRSNLLTLLAAISSFRRMTLPCAQVFWVNGSIIFDVNGSIICSGLHFWRHFDINGSITCGGLHFWRHPFNMTEFLVISSCLWWIMRVVLTN